MRYRDKLQQYIGVTGTFPQWEEPKSTILFQFDPGGYRKIVEVGDDYVVISRKQETMLIPLNLFILSENPRP
jgi:hypothetical protein